MIAVSNPDLRPEFGAKVVKHSQHGIDLPRSGCQRMICHSKTWPKFSMVVITAICTVRSFPGFKKAAPDGIPMAPIAQARPT